MQVQQKPSHLQSFGGINFLNEYLNKIDFRSIVLSTLGYRSLLAKYRYDELLSQIFFICSIGGDALDDSNVLREQFSHHPHLRIASADTIEYAFQELRQPTEQKRTAAADHHINEHHGFNKMLPLLCRATRLLSKTQGYTMDYDGHIVENTKEDNASTYKKTEGYYPVICSINKLPVYMQNRNGNTPESYGAKDIIEKALSRCADNDFTVSRFRADACCYQKDLIEYFEQPHLSVQYYIRAEMNEGLLIALQDEPDWQDAMLNYQKIQVCSVTEPVLSKQRRIVAFRKKVNGQLRIDQPDGYSYHAIITNDNDMNEMQVIEFYNQRGCQGEHHFKELDYDFNWNKLPFDNMEMNTIYLYATAVAYLLFNACKQYYSTKLSFVRTEMRMKNFVLYFITLPAKWIKTSRRWVLKIFSTKDYSPLWCT